MWRRLWMTIHLLPLVSAWILNGTAQDEGPFQVFRIVPTTEQQLQQLVSISQTASSDEADFWHAPSTVNQTVDVMISPEHTHEFQQFLASNGFPFEVAIPDLKKLLIEKESSIEKNFVEKSHEMDDFFASRRKDIGGSFSSRLRMGEYYSYNTLSGWMSRISERLPNIATLIDIGRTVEGRKILGLKFGKESPEKKAVIIDAGIHAREWSAIHTAMYLINTIVNSRDSDRQIKSYLDNLIIYIIPVMNPDGYEYTRTEATNPRARMWRKSRSPKRCLFDGISNSCCMGVDLNRNFGFRFAEIGASKYPCSEIYHGPAAFSEPETQALRDFMMSQKHRLQAYITLHAYSQLWIYSYSHRKFTYAPDIEDTKRVAAKAVAELGKMYGTKYKYGTGPEIIYGFSGGSTDWAKETLKTHYSYTIEVRPTYEEYNGFVLEKKQLIPTAKETWAGIKVVLDEVLNQWIAEKIGQRQLAKIQQERCIDRLSGCQSWLKTNPNLCNTSPQSMVRDCAKSCSLCHKILI